MSIFRIYALIIRYSLVGFRELGRLMHISYFPIIDMTLWGYIGLWIQKNSATPHILLIYLATMALYEAIWSIEIELSMNIIEELESRNLVNLFSTPLNIAEWLISNTITGACKSLFVISLSAAVAYLFFGTNLLSLGTEIIPLIFSIICSGIALGMFLTGILLWGGQQISTLTWSIPYLLLTFSAPFYPISVLPCWMQPLVKALPTSHIFEALRGLIHNGTAPHQTVVISLGLNTLYLIAAIIFCYRMFNRSKQRGLAQLEQE